MPSVRNQFAAANSSHAPAFSGDFDTGSAMSVEDCAPLSFAQQRLWFVEQLAPGTPTYHLPFAVRLRGKLDPDALKQALQAVIRRHAPLRTVIGHPQDAKQPSLNAARSGPSLTQQVLGDFSVSICERLPIPNKR